MRDEELDNLAKITQELYDKTGDICVSISDIEEDLSYLRQDIDHLRDCIALVKINKDLI